MLSQSSKVMGLGFTALLAGVLVVPACDSGGSDNNPTAGSSSGGSSSGAAQGGTGGASAGSTNGGTAGATGGSGGAVMSYSCPGIVPPSNAITDFTDLMPASAPLWGDTPAMNAFYGGLFSYGATDAIPVTDVSMGNLHISGTIKDFSGAGLYVSYCANASKFDGVRFKISGDAGPSKKVLFSLQTNTNLYPDSMAMKGECQAAAANKFTDCVHPNFTVADIGADPKTVDVTWDKLMGGKPATAATTDGKDIVGFQWSFTWAAGTTPYAVDVTIDDVEFIDAGAGGAGSGGAGVGGAGNEPGAAGMAGAAGAK